MCYVEKVLSLKEADSESKRLRRLGVEVIQRRPAGNDRKRVVVVYRIPANVNFGHGGGETK